MSVLDYIERIKQENEGPRITAQKPRTMVADASTEMEQSPDSFLRGAYTDWTTNPPRIVPPEQLEDWDISFRKPNAEGGVQQLVQNTVDGSRPGYQGREWENVIDAGSRSEGMKRLLPKNKSKYISLTELRNLLGEGAEDMRALGGTKDTVVAKASAKLLDQTAIIGPGRDAPTSKKYFYYRKPTKKELELLKTYIDARPIQANMLERIQNLQKDKYTAQILKDGKLPMVGEGKQRVLDPKFMKHVKSKYGTLDKYVHGLVRYSQGLDGQTIIGLNDSILSDGKFKTNKKIANKIRSTFLEMPYGSENASMNTIRKAVYKSAMLDITNELGNTNVTFEQWKDRIRRTLNRKYNLKGADIHIDELIGVSSSMRNKTAPYAVFTQLATKELNEGILKDYQKVLSGHTAKLKAEIGKNSKFVDGKWFHSAEAKKIVNNFNKNILPNLENIDQLKGTGFTLPEMTLGAPTDKTLGGVKGRLATLEKAGLDFKKFYQAEGFGYIMPKNVATQEELFTKLANTDNVKKFKKTFSETFQNLSPRSLAQLSKLHDCGKFKEGGSLISCLKEKFKAKPEKFLQKSAPLAKNNVNLFKWFKNGRKIARGTGIALAWEAAFAPIVGAWSALEGESMPRIINEIAYGIPGIGETKKEEWMKYAGGDELAYKMKRMGEMEEQELPYLYQQLNDAINKTANVPKLPGREGKGYQQLLIEKNIKEKELELQALYNTPELYEGPAGGASAEGDYGYNEPVIQDAYALEQQTTAKIAADKAARKKQIFDWLEENKIIADRNWQSHQPIFRPMATGGRAGYMGGGMTGIRKPDAIPPEKQGLRSIMIGDMDD